MTKDDIIIAASIAGIIWMVIAYFRERRRNDRIYGKGWRKETRKRYEAYQKKLFGK